MMELMLPHMIEVLVGRDPERGVMVQVAIVRVRCCCSSLVVCYRLI